MIPFIKMHGIGNDFVMLDGSDRPELTPELIVALADRRRGVGADGVIVVTPIDGTTARMEYWNADGSPAEMCGNGLRCAAWYAFAREWVTATRFAVETASGSMAAEVLANDFVRVEVGTAEVGEATVVSDTSLRCASVGNPHAVTRVADVADAPVESLGPVIGTHAAFDHGTNVEFMAVHPDRIDLRVWERGVGETLACGSGAVAAAAVAIADGDATSPVKVELPGGTLLVEIEEGRAYLTGHVATVFSGLFSPVGYA